MALRVNRQFVSELPLILQWSDPDQPVPVRAVRAPRPAGGLGAEAPPWLYSGPPGQAFAFCPHVQRLCEDIARCSEELRHLDVSKLQFAITQARSFRVHGLQARVTPMRFRNGTLTRRRRGLIYQVQRYFVGSREILYVVTFCLPRFLELSFEEKFVTLFHELYHISPAFDGDLRRHDGRYCIHSHSQKEYDRHMADLARAYLRVTAQPTLHDFMRLNFAQLRQRHGSVVGHVVPRPKLIPLLPVMDDVPSLHMQATPDRS
jgi:predicted metallopeptidase